MPRFLLTVMSCSALLPALTLTHAAAGDPRTADIGITDVRPIVLGDRPVTLHPAGFPAITITPLWRENGNAWGYHLYPVTTPDPERSGQTDLVDTQNADHDGQLLDMVQDSPHTGEDEIQTVHFASGRVNDTPALLLFITTRDTGTQPVSQPSPAHIRIYQLTRWDGAPGNTPLYFKLLSTRPSPLKTCDADLALSAATKIPYTRWNDRAHAAPSCPWP